ncbi:peptidase inhibitor family I36 protein [Streptomyces sp. NPDC001889]
MTDRFVRMVRGVRLIAVALATVAGTALIAAPPASPAESCGTHQVCVWDQADNTGQIIRFDAPADGTCISATQTWPDGTTAAVRSVYNQLDTGSVAQLTPTDCSGESTGEVLGHKTGANTQDIGSFRVFRGCAPGNVCFWANGDFTGEMATRPWANFCQNTRGITATAVYNNSGSTINLYAGNFCLGANWLRTIDTGRAAPLSQWVGRWNLA